MGKGKRVKRDRETKTRAGLMVRVDKVAEEMEIAVHKAIEVGEERGFMRCMEYVQEKLETLGEIKGIGKGLNTAIVEHFMKVPAIEEVEEEKTVTVFTTYTRNEGEEE